MSTLIFRKQTLHKANSVSASQVDFASNYRVTAYEVGGVVAVASAGNTIEVDSGHGIEAGDQFIVETNSGIDTSTLREVLSVAGDTITLQVGETITVAVGNVLCNLGPDSGSGSSPDYDASPIAIYSDMDGDSAITDSTVTANAQGVYEYHHSGREAIWELIRDGSGSPIAVVRGAHQIPVQLQMKAGSELTIAAGSITITGGYHTVDTEGDMGTDDCWTVNGGIEGQLLIVQAADDARTVVMKDWNTAGNMRLNGDMSLDNTHDTLTLYKTAGHWMELSRSDNTP